MKKIIVAILFLVLFFTIFNDSYAACTYNGGEVGSSLNDCLGTSSLVSVGDASVTGGFKTKIINWVKTIGAVLSLIAVGGIVYGSFELVISSGADETVSKGKNIIKRSVLGFVALLSAGSIIAIVVNIMYALG